MVTVDKPLVWLHGEVKTPPFSATARREAGSLLRQLQLGGSLSLPHSRPMPSIGLAVHELRIKDAGHEWRVIYRIDADAIVIAEVFAKRSRTTPQMVSERCQKRYQQYDSFAK
ncbi:MAG TPA: type II toxin-antitoxin system RelE/ParE family toxin [Pirellulales bacterium]|nr:type II toxin-antitoxin system RelE/ParE family toxin [Pirellulales bacterium]